MTQLQKAIAKIQKRDAPGIGFAPVRRDPPKTLLLAAEVADAAAATAALDAGADFFIVTGVGAADAIKASGRADRGGARLDSLDEATTDALKAAGALFVVCAPANTKASAVDTDNLGFIAVVDLDLDEQTLKALAGLGLDALAIPATTVPETLADQLAIVRLAQLGGAPVIAPVTAGATAAQLRVLRDSGVGLVVVAGASAPEITTLVAAIKALPPRKKGNDHEGRDVAIVPSARSGKGDEEEHDHEDDGE